MESALVQMRVPGDLLERIDAAAEGTSRTAWFLGLAARELDAPGVNTPGASRMAAPGSRSIGPGIPAPGAVCMWPACFSRDCDRYGVTDPAELDRTDYREQRRDDDKSGLALCKPHAAILEGRVYQPPVKELRESWRNRKPDPVTA